MMRNLESACRCCLVSIILAVAFSVPVAAQSVGPEPAAAEAQPASVRLADMDRNQLMLLITRYKDQLADADAEIAALKRQISSLEGEVSRLKSEIEKLEQPAPPPAITTPVEVIDQATTSVPATNEATEPPTVESITTSTRMEIHVLGAAWVDSDAIKEKPLGRYLAVAVAITNGDRERRYVPELLIGDRDARVFKQSLGLGTISSLDKINPDLTLKGIVIFDVPPDRSYSLGVDRVVWGVELGQPDKQIQLDPHLAAGRSLADLDKMINP